MDFLEVKDQISIVILGIIIILEFVIPRKRYSIKDKHFRNDFKWFFLNDYILVYLFIFIENKAYFFSHLGHQYLFHIDLSEWNLFFQVLIFDILYQFTFYWIHRSFHTFPVLWNFHKAHHSTTKVTVTSFYRGSWLFVSTLTFFIILMTNIFRFSELAIGIGIFIRHLYDMAYHCNLRVHSNFLNKIFLMPKDHLWHHSKEMKLSHGQNFGVGLKIWDVLGKTYYHSDQYPSEFGVNDPKYPDDFINRVIHPLHIKLPSFLKKL